MFAAPRAPDATAAVLAAVLAACSAPTAPTPSAASHPELSASSPASATSTAAPAPPPAHEEPPQRAVIAEEEAASVLFPDASERARHAGCASGSGAKRVRCLIEARFTGDEQAKALALELFDAGGDVAGVEAEREMDGGFRGKLHLVPEPPIGRERRHLAWVAEASRDFDAFFAAIARAQPGSVAPRPAAHAGGVAPSPPAQAVTSSPPARFRWRAIAYRFFRLVRRTTPSAYASGWTVAYNVAGSLNVSATSVRETLFHEIFHLNDAAHGEWSTGALGPIAGAIVKRCGTRVACLRPYAPGDTMVRGGTYYAFQPDNGDSVHEYAAELALRYYREHRAVLRGERLKGPPFKCGPEENRRAWAAIVREFFGSVDLVPACP